jgi:hypothetical protein
MTRVCTVGNGTTHVIMPLTRVHVRDPVILRTKMHYGPGSGHGVNGVTGIGRNLLVYLSDDDVNLI